MGATPGAARILDANANRAREGIRTAEDFARFILGDGKLVAELKQLRHQVTCAIEKAWPIENLVCARDSQGDVGADRLSRTGARSTQIREAAIAGMKRAEEAVRVLEETLRVSQSSGAAEMAGIRYRLYALERDLILRSFPRHKLNAVRLYVLIVPESCVRSVAETVEAAIRGGAEAIQLRQKTWEDGEYLKEATKVAEVCARLGAVFIVNDRVDVAAALDADGVHLGQGDLPIEAARRILGPSAAIGRTTRGPEQAQEAFEQGADYVAIGPMFESNTVPGRRPVGLEGLRQVKALGLPIPVFAIGGITEANAAQAIEQGGDRLAVCSAVAGREDAEGAARAIRKLLPK